MLIILNFYCFRDVMVRNFATCIHRSFKHAKSHVEHNSLFFLPHFSTAFELESGIERKAAHTKLTPTDVLKIYSIRSLGSIQFHAIYFINKFISCQMSSAGSHSLTQFQLNSWPFHSKWKRIKIKLNGSGSLVGQRICLFCWCVFVRSFGKFVCNFVNAAA